MGSCELQHRIWVFWVVSTQTDTLIHLERKLELEFIINIKLECTGTGVG